MAGTLKPSVRVFDDGGALIRAAAELFADSAHRAARDGFFRVALSGGRTPKALFHLLAGKEYRDVPWEKIEFFWGDERYVPHTHPDSNYRAAKDILFSKVPVDLNRVHPIPTAAKDPKKDAGRYEETLREVFGEIPRFGLVLLGLGSDGHTASLFPGGTALKETERWAAPAYARIKLPRSRITLTVPVFNAAEKVVFLIAGEEKSEIVREMVECGTDAPAARIQPKDGELIYLLDNPAASKLSGGSAPDPGCRRRRSVPDG